MENTADPMNLANLATAFFLATALLVPLTGCSDSDEGGSSSGSGCSDQGSSGSGTPSPGPGPGPGPGGGGGDEEGGGDIGGESRPLTAATPCKSSSSSSSSSSGGSSSSSSSSGSSGGSSSGGGKTACKTNADCPSGKSCYGDAPLKDGTLLNGRCE